MAKTVLIVEDNELNMKLFRDLLEAHGYQTSGTSNGFEALDLVRKLRPDLILMDIQLLGMSGIQALSVLRAGPATGEIPVIAVTASVMQQDRKQITDAGFDAYLGKPLDLKEFLKTVTRVLEASRS